MLIQTASEGAETIFTFRSIEQGRASLVLKYLRPWEREAVETLTCGVVIS